MSSGPLEALPNLGATVTRRLAAVGIEDAETLTAIGPAEAYRRLCAHEGRGLPVCYYLYSLHGALTGRDWRDLEDREKRELRLAAGVRR